MNIGVIGVGQMGTTRIRIVRTSLAGSRVVAVSDANAEAAERAAAANGIASVYADAQDLIRAPEVEAVIIASPAHTHEAFVLACLDEGKPVLCEKPLAASPEGSLRIAEAESALDRRLVSVGFMRRFDPAYAELKRRLDAGEVGAPLIMHCVHRNPVAPPTFASEMLITESVVHEVDVVRWLLGEDIVRATAFAPRASALAAGGLQDPQVVIFETRSGLLADVECFVNAQYGYDIRCEVVAESGTLELASSPAVIARSARAGGPDVMPGFQQRFGAAFVHETRAWAGGEPGGATAWDGYAAAVVCKDALESLRTGRVVDVRLAT